MVHFACSSVTGTDHVARRVPSDDSCFYAADEDAFVLVACDGAGSRKSSWKGSRAVADAIGRFLIHNRDEVMSRAISPRAVVDVACDTLEELRQREGGQLRDYATTLVALLVSGTDAMTCHIGDGAIFVLEREHPRCLSMPERSQDGGTVFVTSHGAMPRMWHTKVEPHWTGYLCITDGAQPAFYNMVTGAMSPLIVEAVTLPDRQSQHANAALTSFVRDHVQPRTEDDITLVVARKSGVAGLYGCPFCFRPSIQAHWNTKRGRFLGYCPSCSREVFSYLGKAAKEAKRLLEREARRRCIDLSISTNENVFSSKGRKPWNVNRIPAQLQP